MEIEDNQKTNTREEETGIFLKGIVISSSTKLIKKKDDTGFWLLTRQEIALKPGLAVWENFLDPAEEPMVKIEGDEVIDYPHVPDFHPVSLKVLKFSMMNEMMVIKKAEWVA